jgi:hypothetical protein
MDTIKQFASSALAGLKDIEFLGIGRGIHNLEGKIRSMFMGSKPKNDCKAGGINSQIPQNNAPLSSRTAEISNQKGLSPASKLPIPKRDQKLSEEAKLKNILAELSEEQKTPEETSKNRKLLFAN